MLVRLKGVRQDSQGRTVYEMRFMESATAVAVDEEIPIGPNYFELDEMSAAPAAPAANKARVFARDSGGGKTQVCARFATGAVVVLGVEP